MNKLSFSQKNNLVVKHKAKKHFGKDLELFQKHLPSDRLMNDLAKANEFTFERLDGQMLYLLLDKVSINEILENRNEQVKNIEELKTKPEDKLPENPPVPLNPTVPPVDKSTILSDEEKLEELSNRLEALKDNVETNENDIYDLQGELEDKDASIEDLQSKIEALEKTTSGKKKDETGGVPGNSMEQ